MQEQLKTITFCKIPFLKVKETIHYKKYYFLGFQYKVHHNTEGEIIQATQTQFRKAYPDIRNQNIMIILNNLGESVYYARTAEYWYKENTLVACVQGGSLEIFKLLAPQVSTFYLNKDFVWSPEYLDNTSVDGNNFKVLLPDKELIKLNSSGLPFWQNWQRRLNVSGCGEAVLKHAVISEEDRNNAENKANKLGINLQKFVLLIKEATSIRPLEDEFWKGMKETLRDCGFSVLENSKFFSISEIYHLASLAKGIVAVRCGLCDFLCELGVPQFMIYGDNPIHGDLQPMYSFKDIPWAAHQYINEYNTHHQSLDNIQSDILSKIGVL